VFVSRSVRTCLWVVSIYMAVIAPAAASAQSAVGQGPLTSSLPDAEPTSGVLTVGPIKLAPGLTVRELGWDSNVFDEPPELSPKEDYVAALQPDVSAFSQLRFVRLSAYAGSELTYYRTYESERSIGHAVRGRVDFLLSRVRPFIGAGNTETRTRPNGEIDLRADRQLEELSGGVAFDLSAHSLFYGSAYRTHEGYENALEDGIDLGRTLTRDAFNYQVGIKTDITPLLSVQVYGSYNEDRFEFEPERNSDSRNASAVFRFAPDAVVTGTVNLSFRDIVFADPDLKPYRGFTGTAAIIYPFLEVGRFSVALTRGVEYSFNSLEGYYIEQSANVSYTHRLFGEVDAQVRGGRATFEYDARETLPAHTDTMDTVGGSVGYNLRNRTRIALNYEFARRRSPAFALRNYDRRRVYLSWLFAF
jgi:hypothetical protein